MTTGVRDLTKWPRLLVVGDSVTEQQANEILIRTDDWWLSANDRAWVGAVTALAIGTNAIGEYGPKPEPLRKFKAEMGVLDLTYLSNARIVSAWIGGPKGWCDWDGTIGCSTWNIGKWPSHQDVTDDWTAIAAAFPCLNLTAQLVADEGAGEIVGQWTVRDGKVEFEPEPTELIRPVDELDGDQIVARMMSRDGEQGVEYRRLWAALRTVRGRAVA